MATLSYYNVLLPIFTGFLFLLAIKMNSAQAISFNFPSFTRGDDNLILQNYTVINDDGVLLLPVAMNPPANLLCRALYAKPVPLWDANTGVRASFNTSFSFSTVDIEPYYYTPGIAMVFFLAPWTDGNPVPYMSEFSYLGIINPYTAFNQFVAVEFDPHVDDEWDPNYSHIGIDANSLMSLNTTKWNRVGESLEKVDIIYDSTAITLSVVMTHQNGEITTLEQEIDLKSVLPANVVVGFSATVSQEFMQGNRIYSWSFNSTLNTNPAASKNIINMPASLAS